LKKTGNIGIKINRRNRSIPKCVCVRRARERGPGKEGRCKTRSKRRKKWNSSKPVKGGCFRRRGRGFIRRVHPGKENSLAGGYVNFQRGGKGVIFRMIAAKGQIRQSGGKKLPGKLAGQKAGRRAGFYPPERKEFKNGNELPQRKGKMTGTGVIPGT